MRTKGTTVLVMGMSLASATSAEQEEPFNPDLDALKGIVVDDGCYPGWYGTFWLNGSAQLWRSGSKPVEGVASAPEGSFSIKNIYDFVAPHLKKSSADKKEVLNVGLHFDSPPPNRGTGIRFYIEDKDVMRTLMHGLRDRVVPWVRPHFEDFLSKYPFVPGDEPEPFSYGWDEEGFRAARETIRSKDTFLFSSGIIATKKATGQGTVAAPPEPAPAAEETQVAAKTVGGGSAETPPPTFRRPWLYVGTLALLCAGVAFLLIRKKR